MIKKENLTKKNKKSFGHKIIELSIYLIATLAISCTARYFMLMVVTSGDSMNNTIKDKDVYIVNRIVYKFDSPAYKDIVAINAENDERKLLIKRVIGVQGDKIKIVNNHLYINGKLMQEDYIKDPMTETSDMEIEIPEDEVFVMGDNRNNSLDSRMLGTMDVKCIRGKMAVKLCSLGKVFDFIYTCKNAIGQYIKNVFSI